VVSIAFSVTLVAIQQAATQYSPRVLRRFMRDRGNQVVLGTYLGTFVFSLIILGQIRANTSVLDDSLFVPSLSVTVALTLAVISIVMLVYFIHHITQLIQVA